MSKYLKKFFYHTLSDLIKKLYYVDDDKIKNGEVIKHINNGLIEFKNSINRKKILQNENPEMIVSNVEKILDFYN